MTSWSHWLADASSSSNKHRTDEINAEDVSPQRLIRLLLDADWTQVGGREGSYARLVAPNGLLGSRRSSLVVPLDTSAPDYTQLLWEALASVASLRSNSLDGELLTRVAASPSDELSFVKDTGAPKGWISWAQGEELLASARLLLLSGAKSQRQHLRYYGNKFGQFANRFLDEVMMGQTAISSYVVRAYVPVGRTVAVRGGRETEEGGLYGGSLDKVDTRTITDSVVFNLLATTIALDEYKNSQNINAFTDPEKFLSYETVMAIKGLAAGANESAVRVEWDQAGRDDRTNPEYVFTPSAVPILERAANELAAPEVAREVIAVGTVHLLSRAESEGPGVVGITTLRGDPARKIRVHLKTDAYHQALQAHDSGAAIRVRGNLEREGNLAHLYAANLLDVIPLADDTEISLFEDEE